MRERSLETDWCNPMEVMDAGQGDSPGAESGLGSARVRAEVHTFFDPDGSDLLVPYSRHSDLSLRASGGRLAPTDLQPCCFSHDGGRG